MKKLVLFTDGFPWDMGEKPFIYHELCVLAESFDIDIIANVRKQFTGNDVGIQLPDNVKLHKHVIEDVGRKEKLVQMCKVITSKAWKAQKREFQSENIIFKQLEQDAYEYITRATLFLDWINKEIDLEEFDVCYTYWNSYATLALAMYKEKHSNLKLITKTHGYDLYHERMELGRQYFKRYIDGKLDRVVFIAESGRDYYLKNFATGNMDKYLFNAIGTGKAGTIPEMSETDTFTLISCSSVIPLKRVHLIVEALSKIDNKKIHWIHMGGGSELDNITRHCQELLDGKDNISYELKGAMSNNAVRALYDSTYIDCFITTSSTEGSPVSIQEALAYGIPVIGTDVGEISDLIKDCGILIDVDASTDRIAEAISSMCDMEPEDIKHQRRVAYERWQQSFDADKNAKEFVKIVDQC